MKLRELIASWLGLESVEEGEDLSIFTSDQLEEAATKANEAFSTAYEAKDVKVATEAKNAAVAIKAEQDSRIAAEQELSSLNEEMTGLTTTPEEAPEDTTDSATASEGGDGADEGGSDGGDEGSDDGDEGEEAGDGEGSEDGVQAAATPAPRRMPPSSPPPAPKDDKAPVRLLAGADIDGHSPGQSMTINELAEAFTTKANSVRGAQSKVKSRVASAFVDYPTDRMLDRGPADLTTERINEVVAEAQEATARNLSQIAQAGNDHEQINELVAAGGLCAPVNVRYELCTRGDDVRPLRDSLVRFGATRGGIQYVQPPVLANVAGAVNVYTEEQDSTGYDYPKGCVRVECGETVEVKVSAIPLCMEVGNFVNLSFPELFRAWWQLGKVEHARIAETTIWERMCALSASRTANARGLGAARNTLTEIGRYIQQFRYAFRTPRAPLRLWAPDWLKEVLRSDLTNQQPGDGTISVSDAQIVRWFAERGTAVTFVLDGQDPNDEDDLFPDTADVILALEGTFLFLDMGRLDFGTEIRDFTQIKNNDVGAFMETFEEVAAVCNGPQCITLPICDTGLSTAAGDGPDCQ